LCIGIIKNKGFSIPNTNISHPSIWIFVSKISLRIGGQSPPIRKPHYVKQFDSNLFNYFIIFRLN